MHSDVVLMKSFLPNENETRQLQDIPLPELDACTSADFYCLWEKSLVMNMSQQHSEELLLLWGII